MQIGITGLERLIKYKNAVFNDEYYKKVKKAISTGDWKFFTKWCRRTKYVQDIVLPEIKFRQKDEQSLFIVKL